MSAAFLWQLNREGQIQKGSKIMARSRPWNGK